MASDGASEDVRGHGRKTYSSDELVNIGTGEDIAIAEFARVVVAAVRYTGTIFFDASRRDGPRASCLTSPRPANSRSLTR